MAYFRECKCWKLQEQVDLNPNDPKNERVLRSLDSLNIGRLEDEDLIIGEVTVSSDGLVHPESACKPFSYIY